MILFKRFVLMLQFFTGIPIPFDLGAREEDFGKGLVFAPVVGIMLGGIIAGFHFALKLVFPPYAALAITIVLYILLTRGLHLDGLGDTFDGLFSNRPRERMLEIMRDSRVGTNAVLAVISVLLLDIALLGAVEEAFGGKSLTAALVLMPAAGRTGCLIGAGVSGYARSEGGLGRLFVEHCGLKEVGAGFAAYAVLSFAAAGCAGAAVSFFSAVSAFLAVKFLAGKIGRGVTGDILGAVCEINQVLFLAFYYVTMWFVKI